MYRRMDDLAALAKELHADMIFGMGGGKALDTAKGAAEKAGLPVFTFSSIVIFCFLSALYNKMADVLFICHFIASLFSCLMLIF